jgi:hypothetical protein
MISRRLPTIGYGAIATTLIVWMKMKTVKSNMRKNRNKSGIKAGLGHLVPSRMSVHMPRKQPVTELRR